MIIDVKFFVEFFKLFTWLFCILFNLVIWRFFQVGWVPYAFRTSANKDNSSSYSLTSMLCIYSSWLLWPGFSILYWIEMMRVSIFVMFCSLWCYHWMCHMWPFVVLKYLLYLTFGNFYHEEMLNFVKYFLCNY
jgi:hypothetical protein